MNENLVMKTFIVYNRLIQRNPPIKSDCDRNGIRTRVMDSGSVIQTRTKSVVVRLFFVTWQCGADKPDRPLTISSIIT
jgi:hypothetical protein